jgi:hypothetical protein
MTFMSVSFLVAWKSSSASGCTSFRNFSHCFNRPEQYLGDIEEVISVQN